MPKRETFSEVKVLHSVQEPPSPNSAVLVDRVAEGQPSVLVDQVADGQPSVLVDQVAFFL